MGLSLLLLLLGSPVRAQECPALFAAALKSGQAAAPLLRCFQPGSDWVDGHGRRTGKRAVEQGLKSLLAAEPELEKGGLALCRSSGTLFLSGFSAGGPSPRHFVFAVDPSSSGWSNPRLFSAARSWPRPAREILGSAASPARRFILEGFNGNFAKGDVDGWVARWLPDAVFVSNAGPVSGAAELGRFFRRRRGLYRDVSLTVERDHGSPAADVALWETDIRGHCRRDGSPFDIHALLWFEVREGRVSFLEEAFSLQDMRCDPPETGAPREGAPR